MYFYTGDAYKDFDRHEELKQRQLDRLPKCAYCGEPIQDERLYTFDGDFFCIECFNNRHRKRTADYMA